MDKFEEDLKNNSAKTEGYHSFQFGLPVTINPYDRRKEYHSHIFWESGFNYAKDEFEKNSESSKQAKAQAVVEKIYEIEDEATRDALAAVFQYIIEKENISC